MISKYFTVDICNYSMKRKYLLVALSVARDTKCSLIYLRIDVSFKLPHSIIFMCTEIVCGENYNMTFRKE